MPSFISLRVLLTALCFVEASSFGIADTFHLLHHTATSAAVHHAVHHHASAATTHGFHLDFNHLLDSYKQTLAQHPLPTKMATGATLAVAGDAIAQSQDEKTQYDARRASSFAVFDMAYRALQHVAFPIIVASCHGQFLGSAVEALHLDPSYASAMEQTLASQLGIVPFLYYPAFFALTGAVQGLDAPAAWSRAQDMFLPLMKRNLLWWIPCQFIQFGFIETDMQIPFLSVCGLVWTFILSTAAGSTKGYSQPTTAAAVDSVSEAFDPNLVTEDVLAGAITQALTSDNSMEQDLATATTMEDAAATSFAGSQLATNEV